MTPLDWQKLERRLPPLLSVVAAWSRHWVFGAWALHRHVTGNLVVDRSSAVRGGPPPTAQVLAVPVFIVGVAAVWLIAKSSDRRGRPCPAASVGFSYCCSRRADLSVSMIPPRSAMD